MTSESKKRLASLLAERVGERDAAGDAVGMFTTARLLDQVEAELGSRESAAVPSPAPAGEKPRGRRIFVRG